MHNKNKTSLSIPSQLRGKMQTCDTDTSQMSQLVCECCFLAEQSVCRLLLLLLLLVLATTTPFNPLSFLGASMQCRLQDASIHMYASGALAFVLHFNTCAEEKRARLLLLLHIIISLNCVCVTMRLMLQNKYCCNTIIVASYHVPEVRRCVSVYACATYHAKRQKQNLWNGVNKF